MVSSVANVVYQHKGLDICFSTSRDKLGYFINDPRFEGQEYALIQYAVDAIDQMEVTNDADNSTT